MCLVTLLTNFLFTFFLHSFKNNLIFYVIYGRMHIRYEEIGSGKMRMMMSGTVVHA